MVTREKGTDEAPAAAPDGGFGPIGGAGTGRPSFADPVPDGGYAWWYVDALSDDQVHGLTIIAQIGSVFSPWYAWARKRAPGAVAATNHCTMNTVLYGGGGKRWAMTERHAHSVRRETQRLRIGPSAMEWDGDCLTVRIDEITAPLPARLRGTVRIFPGAIAGHVVRLDAAGRHCWSPVAPRARAEVRMENPARRWAGDAYFDMNWGARPLEEDFAEWHWSRAQLPDGTAVIYDVGRRDGTRFVTALRYNVDGSSAEFPPPPEVSLPRSLWRLPRRTRSDAGARVISTLEDVPFYARSVVQTEMLGHRLTAMHEQLSLDRFDTPWMRLMLPFKAPRAFWQSAHQEAPNQNG
jgi:carotenoid 1,2-hydratase